MNTPQEILSLALQNTEQLLRKTKKELAEHLRESESFVQKKNEEIASLRGTIDVLRLEIQRVQLPSGGSTRGDIRTASPDSYTIQADIIREEAYIILQEHLGPLKQKQLAKLMVQKGIKLDSVNPPDLIRATLNRDPRFIRVPYKGYALKG